MSDKRQRLRRREFFGNLREYVARSKATKFFEEEYYEVCEEGSIRIRADATQGVFSPYGDKNPSGKKDLDEGLLEYIEQTAYYIPVDRPLKINISNVAEADRPAATAAYRKHFDLKFNDKCLDLKICQWKAAALLTLGLIFLALSAVLSSFNAGVFNELFAVVASFSMWESVDFFLLERANIKTEKLDAAQLLLATVEYDDPPAQS